MLVSESAEMCLGSPAECVVCQETLTLLLLRKNYSYGLVHCVLKVHSVLDH